MRIEGEVGQPYAHRGRQGIVVVIPEDAEIPCGKVVLYAADADPVAEYLRERDELLEACAKLAGTHVLPTISPLCNGRFLVGWLDESQPSVAVTGNEIIDALCKLHALLEPQEQPDSCPCESLSDKDWKLGQGWVIRTPAGSCYAHYQPDDPCPICGKPLPVPSSEVCGHKNAQWREEAVGVIEGWWQPSGQFFTVFYGGAGEDCWVCKQPLPAKPLEQMSVEECLRQGCEITGGPMPCVYPNAQNLDQWVADWSGQKQLVLAATEELAAQELLRRLRQMVSDGQS